MRLAAAELHFGAGQHDRLAAEFAHRDVEGNARARRGAIENHRQRLARQRTRRGAAVLDARRPSSRPTRRGCRAARRRHVEQSRGNGGRRRRRWARSCRGALALEAELASASAQAASSRRTPFANLLLGDDRAAAADARHCRRPEWSAGLIARAAAANSAGGNLELEADHQAFAADLLDDLRDGDP